MFRELLGRLSVVKGGAPSVIPFQIVAQMFHMLHTQIFKRGRMAEETHMTDPLSLGLTTIGMFGLNKEQKMMKMVG